MESNPVPDVSVVVSTRNRAAGLANLIEALGRQTLGAERFELIVFDDASKDATPDVLREASGVPGVPISSLRSETNQGQAVGRNAAWQQARGRIVAFTDDDCIPTRTWLEEGVRSLTDPCVLVGATEPDTAQLGVMDPLARTVQVIGPTFAPTCNVFYLRDDLRAVGGFDEGFGKLAGEDTDLAWRVHEKLGRELRFAPSCLVHHEVRPRTFATALDETPRWAGIPRLAARHRDLAKRAWPQRLMRRSHLWALIALIGLLGGDAYLPVFLLVTPWLRVRVFDGRPRVRWMRNAWLAPAAFAVDLFEFYTVARAAIKERVLIF